MGNRLSKILNTNRTPAINEVYEKWNGKLRTRNLEKKLTNAVTNQHKKEIKDKIKYANKSTNVIRFSTNTINPKEVYEEIKGDDRLIKRASKACSALT